METEWRIYASVNQPSLVQIMACPLVGAKPLSVGILLIQSLGTNFSEILSEIHTFSFKKNAFEKVVRKMAAIFSQPQCVNYGGFVFIMHLCSFLSMHHTHTRYIHYGIVIDFTSSPKIAAILADNIFKCIFLNGNDGTPIQISLQFVPGSPIDSTLALVQVMAWRRTGDKPLPEPMLTQFADIYMRH